jgi:hypothetical protein
LSDTAEEIPTEFDSPAINTASEVAAAAAAPSGPITPWLLGLGAFIMVPVAGVFALRRKSRASWSIVEDTQDSV